MTNVIEWLLNTANTLKTTFGGVFAFLAQTVTIGGETFAISEVLFGSAIFVVLLWGIASFVIDILP